MRTRAFIASMLMLSVTVFAEGPPGSGPQDFSNFSGFKQRADSMNDASMQNRTREKIEEIRQQEMREMEARQADVQRGKLPLRNDTALDQPTIQAKMASLQPKWTACYQALPDAEKRRGDVQLAFDIAPKGIVQNERVLLESSLRNQALRDCMLKALRTLRFPERKGPTKVTSYPISFTPQPAE